jgi:hypothetical protein
VIAVGAAEEDTLVFTDEQLADLIDRQGDERAAAAAFLALQLRQVLRDQLYGDDADEDRATVGEGATTALVSVGIVRASLQIAGGAPTSTRTGGAALTSDTGAPYGEVASGETVQAAAREGLGAQVDEYEWTWAAAGVPGKPFPPHEDLDGVRFTSWEDDALVNMEGWPPVAFFYPGDHDYCTCAAVPVFVLDEGPALDPF